MKTTKIYDLNACPVNERNGTYGGKAGEKEGVTINDWYWIIKYPKSTMGMDGELDTYTTSPLSEYIGSHIYQIIGIDAHDTLLGIRNDKLVVACKDFCKKEGALREIRTLKNIYNKELSAKLEQSFSSTSSSHFVDIEDMITHLKYNPVLQNVSGITDRFWTQLIVDVLINNNDRNNGNWGVLYEEGEYKIAPVFDNGSSFSSKAPETVLSKLLEDEFKLRQSIDSTVTIYRRNGHRIHGKDIVAIEDGDFLKVALNLIPVIREKLNDIVDFINNIPEKCGAMLVCSEARKRVYIKNIEIRFERYLLPVYEKARNVMLHSSCDWGDGEPNG